MRNDSRRATFGRDSKPSNAILTGDNVIKLLDFGLAKFVEASRESSEVFTVPRDADAGAPVGATAPTLDLEALGVTQPSNMSGPGGAGGPNGASGPSVPEPAGFSPNPDGPVPISFPPAASAQSVQVNFRQAMLADVEYVVKRFSITPPHPPLLPDTTGEYAAGDDGPTGRYSGIKGTPMYMAPELLRGEPASRQSDLYSLGALLYELCAGAPPHASLSLSELLHTVTTRSAPSLGLTATELDPRFVAVVDRCLRLDPVQRFASADEVREALELLVPSTARAQLPPGNPYRGLLAFEAEHRALFFGRKSEIGTLIERLRTESFVLVAADSGVGKSSVCRAGVLPHIEEGALADGRQWLTVSMVPGRHPLPALCAAVRATLGRGPDEAELLKLIQEDPRALRRELPRLLGEGRGLLLFIDQLEELCTIADPSEAMVVGEALGALMQKVPGVRLLMTARGDFIARIGGIPGLGDEMTRSLYILRPMSTDKIREAIVGPAQAKGASFETEALVQELVKAATSTDSGLPLLQFALAELWEAREGDRITVAALASIGGVTGALSRHADHVLGSLAAPQRHNARRILMSLVTLEGTRARRTEEELTLGHAGAHAALESLVRGRLIVGRDSAEGPAYEVAHEALIRGWDTLHRWLETHAERRAVKQRLETAVAEWQRLGRSRELLWSARQLAETIHLEPEELGPRERDFLAASRRDAARRRRVRQALILAVPVLIGLLYAGTRLAARRDLTRRVAAHVTAGQEARATARARDAEVERLRTAAFAAFDTQKRSEGEELWTRALAVAKDAERAYGLAARQYEAAFTADSSRLDLRAVLADVLYERALAAERDHRESQLDDLLQRLGIYDEGGARRRRWDAPGQLTIQSEPPGAEIRVGRYTASESRHRVLGELRPLGRAPLAQVTLPQGSHLLTLSLPGHAEVRYPIVVRRGDAVALKIPLPPADQVPPGLVYVPAGPFLFGSANEMMRKTFLSTVPLHAVRTGAYLIARTETTFAEYIAFLDSLPPAERAAHRPRSGKGAFGGQVELKELPGGDYKLELQPVEQPYVARRGQAIVYAGRSTRQKQDWLRMPVSGISQADAQAFLAWLDRTGRVPQARLCDELEWERGARGADDREFPHGDALLPEDANFDMTYKADVAGMGPDEVGTSPASRSPFGLDDMTGNVFEWVTSRLAEGESLIRGGSYFFDTNVQLIPNRNLSAADYRNAQTGLRVCAGVPPTLR